MSSLISSATRPTAPEVTVIVPAFNAEKTIARAIQSIVAQEFSSWELVVIDDGSTDRTPAILSEISDPRIQVVRQENQGLATTLNRGIEIASAPLIARLDADDYSAETRLGKQRATFLERRNLGLLGTSAAIQHPDGVIRGYHRHPTGSAALRTRLLLDNPFVHSSVMFLRDTVRGLGGYTVVKDNPFPEDFDLWSRMSTIAEVANLSEILTTYVETPASLSREAPRKLRQATVQVAVRNLKRALPEVDDLELQGLAELYHAVESAGSRIHLYRALLLLRKATRRLRKDQSTDVEARETARKMARLLLSRAVSRRLPPDITDRIRRARDLFRARP